MTQTVLITGASSGIGAIYADRFAKRGHDLVLVARDTTRLEALATKLRSDTGVAVEVVTADLTQAPDLARIEARLREDLRIGILVNNAGAAIKGAFHTQATEALATLVALNTTAVLRLASAVAPRFAAQGKGAIINIGSVVGLAPEFGQTVYGATKAFVEFLSQGLAFELGPQGVQVQAVLPAATATEIWTRAGAELHEIPPMMAVGDMVDAALAGFDRGETVTIPALETEALWTTYQAARQAMLPEFGNTSAATRYRA